MKKLLIICASILTLAPVFAFADATSSITLPDTFTANVWAQAQNVFNGLQSYVLLIIGTILATVVIEIIIGALKKPGN